MKIQTVEQLEQHKTVAAMREDVLIIFQVTTDKKLDLIKLKALMAPSACLSLYNGYSIVLTYKQMQNYLDRCNSQPTALQNYYSSADELVQARNKEDEEFTQKLVANHGQTKDDFIRFLMKEVKDRLDATHEWSRPTINFMDQMRQKYNL